MDQLIALIVCKELEYVCSQLETLFSDVIKDGECSASRGGY